MRQTFKLFSCGLAVVLSLAAARSADACFCFGGPPPTLSGQLFEADGAFLARIVAKAEFVRRDDGGEEFTRRVTTCELIDILKPGLADLSPRMLVTLDYDHDGSPGDLVVLFGAVERDDQDTESDDETSVEQTVDPVQGRERLRPLVNNRNKPQVKWSSTESLSWAGYEYIQRLPRDEWELDGRLPWERLAYFVEFLEHPDAVVDEDAFDELDRAEFADLIPLADRLPREKLRRWVEATDEATVYRRHLYGVLLGICGTREDAAVLERIVLANPDKEEAEHVRDGIEGVIVGYLLLTGERGLDVLTQARLADHSTLLAEVQSILDALQILEYLSPQAVPVARLRAAVHRLLERQDCAAEAISALAGLEDWESQDRIIALLDACGYEDEEIRLAILDFLLSSAENVDDPVRRNVAEKARSALLALQRRDPALFEDAGVAIDF